MHDQLYVKCANSESASNTRDLNQKPFSSSQDNRQQRSQVSRAKKCQENESQRREAREPFHQRSVTLNHGDGGQENAKHGEQDCDGNHQFLKKTGQTGFPEFVLERACRTNLLRCSLKRLLCICSSTHLAVDLLAQMRFKFVEDCPAPDSSRCHLLLPLAYGFFEVKHTIPFVQHGRFRQERGVYAASALHCR